MAKDHSDSERGNPLPPHRLLFPISSKGSFICIIPDRIAHTTAFVTIVVDQLKEETRNSVLQIQRTLHNVVSISVSMVLQGKHNKKQANKRMASN